MTIAVTRAGWFTVGKTNGAGPNGTPGDPAPRAGSPGVPLRVSASHGGCRSAPLRHPPALVGALATGFGARAAVVRLVLLALDSASIADDSAELTDLRCEAAVAAHQRRRKAEGRADWEMPMRPLMGAVITE